MTGHHGKLSGLHWIPIASPKTGMHTDGRAFDEPPAKISTSSQTSPPTDSWVPPPESAVRDQSSKATTVYISSEIYTQARRAYRATSSAECDRSWSQFIEKAIAGEIEDRSLRHNGGDRFEGIDVPLSPGRPLAD